LKAGTASGVAEKTNPILSRRPGMDIWTELYDPKDGRKLREIPMGGTCKKCGKWNGHRLDCEEVDTEQLYRIAKQAQAAEEHARKLADRYWRILQQYQGKLATLKHESNKLRKNNERLRNKERSIAEVTEDAVLQYKRLIAAAPVMLQALRDCLSDYCEPSEMMHGRCFSTGNAVRDAIELATGVRPDDVV
jgi:hypothetical protein